MKKYLFLLILISFQVKAQVKNCENCDTKIYTEKDIRSLSLLELKILRNEIFARHNAQFENDRLNKYFSKYSWYKPIVAINQVKLNNTELRNIQLFKKREQEKEKNKKIIIQELKKIKKAVINNDTLTIKSVLIPNKTYFTPEDEIEIISNLLKNILQKINLNDVNWFNEGAFFQVVTDNGYMVNETSLKIEKTAIKLEFNDMTHSKLLEDKAFDYGSSYMSEEEYAITFFFELKNNKLFLVNVWTAG